jgi:hypothetical protein
MIKRTIAPDKFSVLKKYKDMTKKLKALKVQRDEILKGAFAEQNTNVIAFTVRGEGVGFIVEKQESSSVSWKGLAEQEIDEKVIQNLLPDFTKPYNKFLVKI